MLQKSSKLYLSLGIFLYVVCQTFSINSLTIAQQIIPDETLGTEKSEVQSIEPQNELITGGATRGTNLFHSFKQFSILNNGKAEFNNDLSIQNIFVRVTGNSLSNIAGLISAKGTANLLLINPNGIIFNTNASLKIGGSFLATTASRLNFADGSWFSAETPQANSLLKVSVPNGLQFGSNPGAIVNRSQSSLNQGTNYFGLPGGLKVNANKTLALIGGDVLQEGGSLTASGGRIEIGSVSSNSSVNLNQITEGWALNYEKVSEFKNIQLTPPAKFKENQLPSYIDVSSPNGGEIVLRGKNIEVINSPLTAVTTGEAKLDNLAENGQAKGINALASDLITLGGGSTIITTLATDQQNGDNITIDTKQLNIENGAQVYTSTSGSGSAGQLKINASNSVNVSGSFFMKLLNRYAPTGLYSTTVADGKAGAITINTGSLSILDGAKISSESAQRFDRSTRSVVPATGEGGNLIINALNVELSGTSPDGTPSTLLAGTLGSGKAGNILVNTNQFVVRDKAEVAVSSSGIGDAGNLKVQAQNISLDNGGRLTATSELGTEGGNIFLQDLRSLELRRKSEISTSAQGGGNGGNITIATDLLTALENSSITANAIRGRGGNIRITTQGLFLSPNSKITATSERGIDGVVEIDRLENPEGALLTLPAEPVNISGLIAQGCSSGAGSIARRGSEFVITGRGGLPPTPTEAFRGDVALVDLGKPIQAESTQAKVVTPTNNQNHPESTELVEAQGWVVGSDGEVMLTASAPNVTASIPWMKSNSCHG